MQKSKKWSIIALASVVLISVAYFGSTGKLSGLASNVLMSGEVNVCQPERLPFYPDYKQTISQRNIIQNDIATVKQKIEEVQSNVKIFQEKTQTLIEQNKRYASQIDEFTKANKALCVNPGKIKQCNENRTQINTLQNKMRYNDKSISELKKKLVDSQKSLTEYNQQYIKLDSSRLEIITQIDNFEKQIEEACKPPIISSEVGFRRANWDCYNGDNKSYSDTASCTEEKTWRAFSETSCQNKCSIETGKCGVNSFSVSESCEQATVCGNGTMEKEEECDDGAKNGTDNKCSSECKLQIVACSKFTTEVSCNDNALFNNFCYYQNNTCKT